MQGGVVMKWVNCELPKETAGRFKEYCRDMHIKFEASECGNLIHFECKMNAEMITKANKFIEERC
jgi:hypothetical protein